MKNEGYYQLSFINYQLNNYGKYNSGKVLSMTCVICNYYHRSFPTIADASTEIINLEAILNLPKGTEHFLTDIHGEYEAFQHVLKKCIGGSET